MSLPWSASSTFIWALFSIYLVVECNAPTKYHQYLSLSSELCVLVGHENLSSTQIQTFASKDVA